MKWPGPPVGPLVNELRGYRPQDVQMKIFLYNMNLLSKSAFIKKIDLLVKILTLFSKLPLLLCHYYGPPPPPFKAKESFVIVQPA